METTNGSNNVNNDTGSITYSFGSYDDNSVNIGRFTRSGVDESYFPGIIDDVRVYNYARTQNQINMDMDNSDPTKIGFVNGDNAILINKQGDATNNSNVGNYEFLKVDSTSSNTITFTSNIQKIYGATVSNSDLTGQKIIIQRVPQYSDVTIATGVTITGNPWRGSNGGILAMKASGTFTANTNGYLSMADKGYRGGDCNGCGNNNWGDQGEGIGGTGTGTLSANFNGGGGGYGPSGCAGDPGAGGGHANAGGNGSGCQTSIGGQSVGGQTMATIFMGGGGGGGGDNDGATPYPRYTDGGGIVILFAETISSFYADVTGEDGISSGSADSGGGAGGSILIKGVDITVNTVTSAGGASASHLSDVSGAGSDGRNAIYYINSLAGSTTPSAYTSQTSDP